MNRPSKVNIRDKRSEEHGFKMSYKKEIVMFYTEQTAFIDREVVNLVSHIENTV